MKIRFAVLTLLLVTSLLATSAPAAAGIVMKQVTRTEGEGAQAMNMTTRISIDTGGARIEFLDSSNPMMPAGSYMLIRPDDDGMVLVNPEKKTYTIFDIGALMQSMSAVTAQSQQAQTESGMETKTAKPIVEKLLEEDGGTLLGYRTKHFRWRTQTSMTMELPMGMSMGADTDATEDVWVADITIDPKILRNFERFADSLNLSEEIQELVAAEKVKQKGIPLKQVVVSTTRTTGGGMMAAMMKKANKEGEKPVKRITEVVELSEEKVPASVFAIPAGYTETELLSPGMKMPEMNR